MSLYGAFAVSNLFSELNTPLVTQEGVKSAATMRGEALQNLLGSTTITVAELLALDVVAGTGEASKAVVFDSVGKFVMP